MSRVTSSTFGAFHTDDFRIDGFVHDGPYWELPIEVLPRVITDEEDSEKPPDGGVLAWLHVFVGFFIIMNAQGLNQASQGPRCKKWLLTLGKSYGVFQAYYETVLLPHESSATIAWIGSTQVFLLFFMSIVVSPLVDKGLFRLCFHGGSLLLVASVFITSCCTHWWQFFLVQGVMTGAGMGLVFASGSLILMAYFSKHIGLALGLASSGGSVGGMVFPAVAQQLVTKIGFPWTVRVIALIVLVTIIPAQIVVRERKGWKRKASPSMDWTMFRDVPYLLMAAGLFFMLWGIYFGFYYIVVYGQTSLHLPPTPSITLLILMNALNAPGRILPTLISDTCLGPLNTLIPIALLTSFTLYIWIGCTTHVSLIFLSCFYGLCAGGLQGLYIPLIRAFSIPKGCPIEAENKVGVRLAFSFFWIGVATLTGAPLGGALLGKMNGGFLGAQLCAGSSVLVGSLLLIATRWTREGWGPAKV